MSQDKNQQIRTICNQTLDNITANELNSHLDIIDNIFLTHLTRLPRIICTGDEEEQTAAFLLLKGLLLPLSKHNLKILLSSQQILIKFVQVLLTTVELELPIDLLHEEYSKRDINDPILSKTPWKSYKHLRNQDDIFMVYEIGGILGKSTAVEMIVMHLLDLFQMNIDSCNEILLLLQFILSTPGGSFNENLIKLCLNELLKPLHWDLAIKPNQTTNMSVQEVCYYFDYFYFLFVNNFL